MISVAEAYHALLRDVELISETESCALAEAHGRLLAKAVTAVRDQPPFPASAMDGYAVRAGEAGAGRTLRVVGESKAGQAFHGSLRDGECVRIFTGAPIPLGCDAILIQEDAEDAGDGAIRSRGDLSTGRFVRPRGIDFEAGATLLPTGTPLTPGALTLAASAGYATLSVRRRPIVAVIATGDELVEVGTAPGPDEIFASSVFGVRAILESAGAVVHDCGIAADTCDDLDRALDRARDFEADLVVTLGGASVGDHDLVRPVFAARGVDLSFSKVAMRPGKPLMHGRAGRRHYLGLPGNPVSSLVCTRLFGCAVVAALRGVVRPDRWLDATLERAMPANDEREEFARGRLVDPGGMVVRPVDRQDSSLVTRYAGADVLIHRPPHAPEAPAGEPCRILPITVAAV